LDDSKAWKDEANALYMRALISSLQPFSHAEHRAVAEFWQHLSSKTKWMPPSRPTLSGPLLTKAYHAAHAYTTRLATTRSSDGRPPLLSLSFDLWKGRGQRDCLGVNLHVQPRDDMANASILCLAVLQIHGYHDAESIKHALELVLEDYDLGLARHYVDCWRPCPKQRTT
jgi:hypothetical protein